MHPQTEYSIFMKTAKYVWEDLGAIAEMSAFVPDSNTYQTNSTCEEYHVMLHVEPRSELFEGQLKRIQMAEQRLSELTETQGTKPVFKRYFLSDATNQAAFLPVDRTISIIQQPPLDGSKIAVWIYFQKGSALSFEHNTTVVKHNGYQHLYQWGQILPVGDSYTQTKQILESYEEELSLFNATLEENCIRTWFFVRDVDTQYAGMVKARKENFIEQGLTENTHYIASTGIGGLPTDPKAIVQMGTYALKGFESEQQYYLYASSHLNPTYEYGVTFERGTVVEFGDRAEVYISGTASINNKGEVLHVGNILKQTERMLENVETLLNEGKSTFEDVAQMIVYLRDMGDYSMVKKIFDERFPNIPRVFTLAPVCRPSWLIEMECIAIPHRNNANYRPL